MSYFLVEDVVVAPLAGFAIADVSVALPGIRLGFLTVIEDRAGDVGMLGCWDVGT